MRVAFVGRCGLVSAAAAVWVGWEDLGPFEGVGRSSGRFVGVRNEWLGGRDEMWQWLSLGEWCELRRWC